MGTVLSLLTSRRERRVGPPSARLSAMLAADLPDHTKEIGGDGFPTFVPAGPGPVIHLRSRIVKRFLGRTEIAVFEVHHPGAREEQMRVDLRHVGGLRRSGVAADVRHGGEQAQRLATTLAGDPQLRAAALPLDFTSFEIVAGDTGTRALIELMGASHVAIALPPIRSLVRLHPDQRDALIATTTRVVELLDHR